MGWKHFQNCSKTLIQSIQNDGLKLCHFETKVKVLKLSWVKRLTCEEPSNCKIFPKAFYNCQNLSTYFNAKHKLLTPKHISIPNFDIHIHNLFMKFFKNGQECISDIINESLWLNDNIMVNTNYLYLKSWENNGISQIRDILNENGEFLKHEELKQKYNITTTFLQTIQVQTKHSNTMDTKNKQCRITKNIHNTTDGIYLKNNSSLLPVSKKPCESHS